jgi:predicted Zn-dependent protease with MMP-like domain
MSSRKKKTGSHPDVQVEEEKIKNPALTETAGKICREIRNVGVYKDDFGPDDLRAALVVGELRKDDIGLMTGIHLTRRLLARLAEMTAHAAIERRMDRAFNRMWAWGITTGVLVTVVISAIASPFGLPPENMGVIAFLLDFTVLAGLGCALAWAMCGFMESLRHYRFYRDKLVHGRWLVPGGIDVGQAYVDFYDKP